MSRKFARTWKLAAAGSLALSLALSGCASDDTADASSATTEPAPAAASAEPQFTDGWAKAGEGMTSVFGTLTNSTADDLELVGATSEVAGMVELHETITSGDTATMQPIEGSLPIASGESIAFEPGGNHIMLMDMSAELLAGDEVPITLDFADGTTLEVTVLVKDYSGAEENYESDDSGDDMNKDDMDEMEMGEE